MEGHTVGNFKDLEVWKKGVDISDLTYDITDAFPDRHKFGIGRHLEKHQFQWLRI